MTTTEGRRSPDLLPFSRRRRSQLGGALLFAVFLPWAVRAWIGIDPWDLNLVHNTIIGNAIAVAVGFYIYRSITIYPGIQGGHSILPTFAAAFGIVWTVFLFGRLDYSRALFLAGFLGALLWYYLLVLVPQRRRLRIGVVPFGDVDEPSRSRNTDWQVLVEPSLKKVRRLDVLVADFRSELPPEWERFLADATLQQIPVLHVKQISESLTGRVSIEHLSENNLGSLIPDHVYIKIKLLTDIVTALFFLLLSLPLLVLIGIAIRLDSPGPALFRQQRVGYGGRPFTVYKFRTMHDAGSEAVDRLQAAMTDDDDPRVTRIGRLLRRSRIDELPQMINILRGEMSWIGPRPEAEVLSDWYETSLPFYRYRHIVRPGITGWAQVNQGHVAEVDEVNVKLQYDFYYIRYFSPWLDALIVVRTVWTVLSGFGSR